MMREAKIEELFIKKLEELKYSYRRDIRDRNSLEQNFREKFESLNRVRLLSSSQMILINEIKFPKITNNIQILGGDPKTFLFLINVLYFYKPFSTLST